MRAKSRSSTTTKGSKPIVKEFQNPFHPGEILLEEFLNPLGLSQAGFAEKCGWPPSKLNEIVRGRRGVTAETAIVFSEALGTTARFWMNLQSSWDLHQARLSRKDAA